jgi:hypothetical protein
MTLLPGALVNYREWYGEDPKRPGQNIGLKLSVEEWAGGVLKRSRDEEVAYDVVDTQMFAEDGGPSQAERAGKVKMKGRRLNLRKADKQRLAGWSQVRGRLRGDEPEMQGPPMLFFTLGCPDAIRTISSLQHDDVESKFEDADSEGEDHAPDGIRYGCMSRPRKLPDPQDRFAGLPKKGSMEWLTSEAWKGRPMPGLSRRPVG